MPAPYDKDPKVLVQMLHNHTGYHMYPLLMHHTLDIMLPKKYGYCPNSLIGFDNDCTDQ